MGKSGNLVQLSESRETLYEEVGVGAHFATAHGLVRDAELQNRARKHLLECWDGMFECRIVMLEWLVGLGD